MALLIGVTGALGLVVGSFLNVVVHRVPAGQSVVAPGSRCPACARPVRRRHNVPVLGWLVLRGRCRDCAAPISAGYPAVELATAALFVLTLLRLAHLGRVAAAPAYLYLAAAGLALALIDRATHRLPDAIVLPSYAVTAALLVGGSAVSGDWRSLARAVLGCLLSLGLHALLWGLYPAGMGFGDVKLAGLLGLALGYLSWAALVVGTAAAFVLGGVVGVLLLLGSRRSRRSRLAFGPFMVAGVWVALLAAQPIAASYLTLVRPA